jgi:TPR repeat protein
MRNLTATLCLTLAVLLGSAGMSWGAETVKGYCLAGTKHSHSPVSGQCSAAYESGNYTTALREWKPLAEQGDADAQFNLGQLYVRGDGVPQNNETAMKWYTLAAEQGNAVAQNNLGGMYRNGQGVPQNDKTAVKWYTLAAEQGNAVAQFNLGLMYDNGRGVTQDDKTAMKWYTLAAEQGVADAQKKVEEVEKRIEAAEEKIAEQNELRKLQTHAKQGNADAQYNLGVMYDNGEGVPQDDETAMKWFGLAAKQGNSDAQQRYGELLLEDFVYGSDVRALEDLAKSVETLCQKNHARADGGATIDFKCTFDKIWAYLDITGDGRLSLAEISRFQRNIVKFVAVEEAGENVIETAEIVAINLVSIIFLPITASSILHSFDYNNDGLLSKNEVFGDTEFSKLVGINVETLATSLDFYSLGEKLQDTMDPVLSETD